VWDDGIEKQARMRMPALKNCEIKQITMMMDDVA
jgi:hypothetical protein